MSGLDKQHPAAGMATNAALYSEQCITTVPEYQGVGVG